MYSYSEGPSSQTYTRRKYLDGPDPTRFAGVGGLIAGYNTNKQCSHVASQGLFNTLVQTAAGPSRSQKRIASRMWAGGKSTMARRQSRSSDSS
jgi:hypothetical protein